MREEAGDRQRSARSSGLVREPMPAVSLPLSLCELLSDGPLANEPGTVGLERGVSAEGDQRRAEVSLGARSAGPREGEDATHQACMWEHLCSSGRRWVEQLTESKRGETGRSGRVREIRQAPQRDI